MADNVTVQLGENSAEQIAWRLMMEIAKNEKKQNLTRKDILDLYAECIDAVRGKRHY